MEELITKENDIFDILQKFIKANLNFIVVGGYAVSSYKHRFSVDAQAECISFILSEEVDSCEFWKIFIRTYPDAEKFQALVATLGGYWGFLVKNTRG